MTKYEELDIENMTQADLWNIILEGDRITFHAGSDEGPTVRTVKIRSHNRSVELMREWHIPISHFGRYGVSISRVERLIPEVVLPTVPGYYMSDKHVRSLLPHMYELRIHDQWYGTSGKVTAERMREIMPLTRLVPETGTAPAKLRDRIDLDKMAEHLEHSRAAGDSWRGGAATILAAIDSGELDK